MTLDEAVETLNTLSVPTPEQSRRLSLEEVRDLVKDPPKQPRSIPMEQAMAVIVEAFRNGQRTFELTKHARRKFLGFAANMAVLAVRENAPDRIEQGLIALVIEDGGGDWRDSVVVLFQLYHSAEKLGMETAATFAKIAPLANPGIIKKEMTNFPLRPPESRSLKAFCMAEEISEEGFRYRQIPWSAPALARNPDRQRGDE
jgi:hypothetical protein